MMTEKDYKVIQKIQFNITDLKTQYIDIYGMPSKWTEEQIIIFCTNCDLQIVSNMEAFELPIHKGLVEEGMLYYIEKIQSKITKQYIKKYGFTMEIDTSAKMYDLIDSHIYDFLIKGERKLK
jgi:hypothetical protein